MAGYLERTVNVTFHRLGKGPLREVPMDYITEDRPEYSLSLRVERIEIDKGVYDDLITKLPHIDLDIRSGRKASSLSI